MPRDPRKARVPSGHRLYAIGDIHGRPDLLTDLVGRIAEDSASSASLNNTMVFLGDYVDRGANSAGVLDQLSQMKSAYETVFLKGNHESMLIDFMRNPDTLPAWAAAGGLQTLVSYGLSPPLRPTMDDAHALRDELVRVLPHTHISFLLSTRLFYAAEDYFFVHAGIRPGISLKKQVEADLLWIRNEFLEYRGYFEKRIVHGHTPVKAPDVLPNRINIDTGAFATGRLTCLVLEEDRVRFL